MRLNGNIWNSVASQLLLSMHGAWLWLYVCVSWHNVIRDKRQNGNSTRATIVLSIGRAFRVAQKCQTMSTQYTLLVNVPSITFRFAWSPLSQFTMASRSLLHRFFCCSIGCHRLMSIVHDHTFIQQVYYYCSSLFRCREQTKNRIIPFNSAYREVTTLSISTLNGSLHATTLAMAKRHVNEFVAANWTTLQLLRCAFAFQRCFSWNKFVRSHRVVEKSQPKLIAREPCSIGIITITLFYYRRIHYCNLEFPFQWKQLSALVNFIDVNFIGVCADA